MTRLRKYGAVGFTAQKNPSPIEGETSALIHVEGTQAKGHLLLRTAIESGCQSVEVSFVFVPAGRVRPYRNLQTQGGFSRLKGHCLPHRSGKRLAGESKHILPSLQGIQLHIHLDLFPMGIDPQTREKGLRPGHQTKAAHNAVPVGLRLVGGGGRIENGLPGHAGVTVIGAELQLILSGKFAC